jgi:hypothetical protein
MANNTNRDFLIFILVIISVIVIMYVLYSRGDMSLMEHSRDYYRGSMPHY